MIASFEEDARIVPQPAHHRVWSRSTPMRVAPWPLFTRVSGGCSREAWGSDHLFSDSRRCTRNFHQFVHPPVLDTALGWLSTRLQGGFDTATAGVVLRISPIVISRFGHRDHARGREIGAERGAAPEVVQLPFGSFGGGTDFYCGALATGPMRCWGKTESLGLPEPGTLPIEDLAAGDGFACALLADKTVRCWGAAPTLPNAADVTATSVAGHTLCVRRAASVDCVGDVVASWHEGVARFAIGTHSVCAQLGARDIRCVGASTSGQLEPPLDPMGKMASDRPADVARRLALFNEFLGGFAPATYPLHLDRTAVISVGDRIPPRFRDFMPPSNPTDPPPRLGPPRYGVRLPTPGVKFPPRAEPRLSAEAGAG
jgi:hypothetical protein